ncbi:MAG: BON domain-containing protein [Aquabacterium sp.]|uniref:BON domain-containing protein n=1 Tax=Aquabacterium sp. TaxID=1872578 RepID=UPI00271BAB5D|nr:BON domain-containing protein [Aquabacterium sp.]MDO9002107.1 BON domain-containing protein [Aquabacterium sp.]
MNHRLLLIAPLTAGLLALAACDNKTPTTETAGQKLDSVIASTEQKTEQLSADAKVNAAEAQKDTSEALSDAAITTRVNAQLAADPTLSAIKIDVDTSNGRVRLSGTAPDDAARDRATTMASAVSGVVTVDNQLKIDKKS